MADADDPTAILAELKRRGALPARAAPVTRQEFAPSDNAYLVIIAEAVNQLARSVAELRTQLVPQPRTRTIERDEQGNITRIIEE